MASYTPDMTIAQMIRTRLEEVGAPSEDEAARQIGVKQPSVNRWKNGKAAPKAQHVPAIARFLGVSEAVVLTGIQNFRMASQVPDGEANVRYLMEQLIAYQDLLPPKERKAAREIIEEMFGWLPATIEDAMNSQFAAAADKGKARKPVKRVRTRPSPEPNE